MNTHNMFLWRTEESYSLGPTNETLNSVSFQCTRGKSSLARKSEVHPKCF